MHIVHESSFILISYTLETKLLEPENHLFGKENHLPNLHFFGVPAVNLQCCYLLNVPSRGMQLSHIRKVTRRRGPFRVVANEGQGGLLGNCQGAWIAGWIAGFQDLPRLVYHWSLSGWMFYQTSGCLQNTLTVFFQSQWSFLVPLIGGRKHIITQFGNIYLVYKWYILPIG